MGVDKEEMKAQIERQVSLPDDPEKEQLKLLIKTGITQGVDKNQFREILDKLEIRFIRKPPLYTPGAPKGWNAYHGGQADVVKFIKYVCGEIKYS